MKSIKALVLTALAVLMAMAFAGTSSAMAESTALCNSDVSPCETITHPHATTLGASKTKLLTNVFTIECDGLFLGDTQSSLGSPLIVEGTVTYSNCNNKCTVTEENGPAEVKVLKLGHESADLTFKLLLHMVCEGFLNCSYIGEGLVGTLVGSLLSVAANGEIIIQKQPVKKDSGGFLCPSKGEIDAVGTLLDPVYITA